MSASSATARRFAPRLIGGVGAVALLTGLIVLIPGGPGGQRAAAAELTPFDNCDELRAWFADAALPTIGPYGFGSAGIDLGMAGMPERAVASDAGGAEAAAASGLDSALSGDAVGPGATGTNVQEAGVDEPDLVKSDGSRLVVVRQERLHVLDITGDEPRELGSLTLPGGAAGELLLVGDRALVLGSAWPAVPLPLAEPVAPAPVAPAPDTPDAPAADTMPSDLVAPGQPSAMLTVVDLTDPAAPSVVHTDEIEGGYVSAREHDGTVRVVLMSAPDLPFRYPEGPGAEAEATKDNRRIVQEASAQDWLPQRIERDAKGNVTDRSPLLECTAVSHPAEPAGLGVITVLTLDLDNPETPASVAVAADGDLVYASTDRLYVATTRGGWFGPMPVDVARAAVAIDMAPADARTQLHAFDVTGSTTTYVASGEVEGWLMGRWAMSEHEGNLRVATTRDLGGDARDLPEPDQPNTDAAVTALAERGTRLEVIGSVGGLGKGEQVRAVRWFGDVATVVTFRQTDPLYTVDLSDPASPRVLGELKIPGYSAYLHPVGNGLLLGVGQDATEEGRTLGTQVSTFDLTDLTEPTRIDSAFWRNSWTDVESDSRQFTYLPDGRIAILPVADEKGSSSLWGLRVGGDGRLSEAGIWEPGRETWIMRAIPVGPDRVAAVTEGRRGAQVTMLSSADLEPVGSAKLR